MPGLSPQRVVKNGSPPRAQRGTIRFFFVFHPILSEQEEPGIILFLAKNL